MVLRAKRAKRVRFSVGRAASDEEVYIVSMALMDEPFAKSEMRLL